MMDVLVSVQLHKLLHLDEPDWWAPKKVLDRLCKGEYVDN
jgi:hypothetical protein